MNHPEGAPIEERHKDLDDLIETGSPAGRGPALSMLGLVALPFLLLWVYDFGTRSWTERPIPRLPWQEPAVGHSDAWGDLIRIAGLPRFAELFDSEEERAKSVEKNSRGFRDPKPLDTPCQITVAGASFCAAGTDYDRSLAGQLEKITGRTTRSLAWPGAGPIQSIEWALSQKETTAQGDTVVWGIVQRSLQANSFVPLAKRLSEQGDLRSVSKGSWIKSLAKKSLRWHNAFEEHLKITSPARDLAKSVAPSIPPIAIDPGWTSPVSLVRWRGEPALFYTPAVASVFQSFESRGGQVLVNTIDRARLAFEKRGQRLLVVLIPDKYQVARGNCEPSLDEGRDAPETPVTEAFRAALEAKGIEVMDLLPQFRAGEAAGEGYLYRRDDTHWADVAIRMAAEAIAQRLSKK